MWLVVATDLELMTETFACKAPPSSSSSESDTDTEGGAPVFNPTRPTPTQTTTGLLRLQPFIAQPHPLVRPGTTLTVSAQQLLNTAIKRARRSEGMCPIAHTHIHKRTHA